MVDQVSLLNYINKRPELNRREKEVYDALAELGEATSWEILTKLNRGLNPNYVRPRLSDMIRKGKKYNYEIIEKSKKVVIDGINQYKWRIVA